MATIQLFEGMPDHDWQQLLSTAFAMGTLSGGGTEILLTFGDIVVTFTGTDLVTSGPRLFDSGSVSSIAFTQDSVPIALADGYTNLIPASRVQAALDVFNTPPTEQQVLDALGEMFYQEATTLIGSDEDDNLVHSGEFATTSNGGGGNDTISTGFLGGVANGGDGNDTIFGSATGDDEIDGGEGDDTVYLTDGTDELIGGDGVDMVILPGVEADYALATVGDTLVVTWAGGVTTLSGFEWVQIGASTYDFDWLLSGEPIITSDGAGANAEIDFGENATFVTTVAARDPNLATETLSYSIIGGDDAARFQIDVSTGALSFMLPPDFENPSDVDDDGVYHVRVMVEDGNGHNDQQDIAITVQDEDYGVHIEGTNGNDIVDATTTPDHQWFPTNEDDDIRGFAGDDQLSGLEGNDRFIGDQGNDTINGGVGGDDMIDYLAETGSNGIVVNLSDDNLDTGNGDPATIAAHTAIDTHGDTDTLIDVENVIGTDENDLIIGGNGRNNLEGLGGNDLLIGGNGDNHYDGGAGNDVIIGGGFDDFIEGGAGDDEIHGDGAESGGWDNAEYIHATAGIHVVKTGFRTGTVDGAATGHDTFDGIEIVVGSDHNDVFDGSSEEDHFTGNDGADAFNGGGDYDEVDYEKESYGQQGDQAHGVIVNLSAETLIGAEAEGIAPINVASNTAVDSFDSVDQLNQIEGVRGSKFADLLIGSDGHNRFDGNWGDDQIEGRGGEDSLTGGRGDDILDGGIGEDEVNYRSEQGDPNDFGAHGVIVNLSNEALVDVSVPGIDPTTVAAHTAIDTYGQTDQLISIENVYGTENDDLIVGGEGENHLIGNAGDDHLVGGGDDDFAADFFRGGRGNDTIIGGTHADEFNRVQYNGETSTGDEADRGTHGVIVNLSGEALTDVSVTGIATTDVAAGTAIDSYGDIDTLQYIQNADGTQYDDIIVGGDEDNDFDGRDGNDTLIGGNGHNNLRGGDGNDTLIGGAQDDFVNAGRGDDVADGGGDGEGEYDNLEYHESEDGITVNKTNRTDGTVTGTWAGTDTFTNFEIVVGSNHADTFNGSSDDDDFTGNAGADTFNGADGFDRVVYEKEQWAPGGESSHGVIVNLSGSAISADVGQGLLEVAAGTAIDAFGDTDTLNSIEVAAGSWQDDHLQGGDGDEELEGQSGNDMLIGGNGENRLWGGDGNDTIIGGDDHDDVDGGRGDDTISTGGGDFDYINGSSGTDMVNGGSGFDMLAFPNDQDGQLSVTLAGPTAGTGTVTGELDGETVSTSFVNVEHIVGTRGDDSFVAAAGAIATSDSRDFYLSDGDDETDDRHVGISVSGGAGADTFTDTTAVHGGRLIVDYQQEKWSHQNYGGGTFGEGAGQSGVVVNMSDAAVSEGVAIGQVRDTFGDTDTADGVRAFRLSDANDVFYAGDGGYSVQGQDGDDVINGGAGDDNLGGDHGDDTINAGDGNDWLGGWVGNDTLNAGAGNDAIEGDEGDDVINGGSGDDWIRGGKGNDTIDGGDDRDTVEYKDERDENDNPGSQGVVVNLSGDALVSGVNGSPIGLAAHSASDSFGDLDSLTSVENVFGTDYADYIVGDDANNRLAGGGGDDTLIGGAGNNNLYGNDGNDQLLGGSQDDWMAGGAGNDHFEGGTGWNNIVYTEEQNGGGSGVTFDWVNGTSTDSYGDTDTFANINSVHGTNGVDTFIGNNDENTFHGYAGNDIIIGAGGRDAVHFHGEQGYGGNNGVTVVLDDGTGVGEAHGYAVDGFGDIDQLSDIEDAEGTTFADSLTGSAGNNLLIGLEGDDLLDGAGGDDTLVGGAGNDLFVYAEGDVVIEDFVAGMTDDVIDLGAITAVSSLAQLLTFVDAGNHDDVVITFASGQSLTLQGVDWADLVEEDFIFGDTAPVGTPTDANATVNGIDENTPIGTVVGITASAIDPNPGDTITYSLSSNPGGLFAIDSLSGVVTKAAAIDYETIGGSIEIEVTATSSDGSTSAATFAITIHDLNGVTINGTSAADVIDATHTPAGQPLPTDEGDTINGNGGSDTIHALGGNDTINGGIGNDTMHGGAGDDIYVVDAAGDVAVELAGQGNDTIQSSVTRTLDAEVENLTLTGASAINGTGNILANTITGNSANNILNGGAGADHLAGGLGNDTYVVDAGDVVTEAAAEGTDLVQASVSHALAANVENLSLTGTANINATGNAANNTLTGNIGNNVLDGAGGTDVLIGGAGNDTYIVDSTTDTVTEGANAGIDTVDFQGAGAYALGGNVENLVLGIDGTDGTGNGLVNTITGNASANVLNGLAGADTLIGGDGDDTYIVDNAGDAVVEASGEGVDLVQSTVSHTLAAHVDNLTLVGTSGINGTGNELGNVLTGNTGANVLNGMAGADTMIGGAGNDTYGVDDLGDLVDELSNGGAGIDTVQSSISFSLGDAAQIQGDVERLTLTGIADIDGTGNELNNIVTGNSGNNVLDGALGTDTLIGGLGDDTYVTDGGDTITEAAASGTDTVRSSVNLTLGANLENLVLVGAAILGTGNALANTITGNDEANILNGAAGEDTLIGGAGDDTYVVDNAGDVVVEAAAEGTDLVQASASYTLSAEVENLTLTGTSAINGTGNAVANTLTGNSATNTLSGGGGNDTLNGGGGADTLIGGTGDDTYVVDNVSDAAVEAAGEGMDTVLSSVTHTLGAEVENLTLTGVSAINGIGNALANLIIGNTGNNVLNGLAGADTLIGGAGNDTYVVDDANDTIDEESNFGAGIDTVQSSISFSLADGAHVLGEVERLTLTGAANINGTGNASDNLITGSSGSNILDGGAGTDTMVGGLGNDTYLADIVGDLVTEAAGGGTDTVIFGGTAGNFILGGNVENLTLGGTAAIDGTGNTLANVLLGNGASNQLSGGGGNDTLNGGGGADILIGGAGNDTYVVDNANDHVDEAIGGSGVDTVQSSVHFSLLADSVHVSGTVENLILTGTGSLSGTGNALDNALMGNSGANTLFGGAGDDTLNGNAGNDTLIGGTGQDDLFGGSGNDTFDFNVADFGGAGGSMAAHSDEIFDFVTTDDKIDLSGLLDDALAMVGGNANSILQASLVGNDLVVEVNESAVLDGSAVQQNWGEAFTIRDVTDPEAVSFVFGGQTWHHDGGMFGL